LDKQNAAEIVLADGLLLNENNIGRVLYDKFSWCYWYIAVRNGCVTLKKH